MNWQIMVRGLCAVAVLVLSACGGGQAPPSEYGYGDMFEDDDGVVTESAPSGGMTYSADEDVDYGAVDEEPMEEMAAVEAEESTGWGGRRAERRNRLATREAPPPPPPAPAATPPPQTQAAPEPAEPAYSPIGGEGGGGGEAASTTTPSSTTEPVDGNDSGRSPAPIAEGDRATPLMIYEATLGLAVHEVPEKIDETVRITHEIGGHVQSQTDTSVIVRVPAARFREALALFEALGDVEQRRISAQDVSEQVRDIQIRLRNAVQMRDRLAQLLEAAQTIPESLAIEHELERLNETIALMEGALESLQDRIAFSTITVNFRAIQNQEEIPRTMFRLPFSWLDELGLQHLLQL